VRSWCGSWPRRVEVGVRTYVLGLISMHLRELEGRRRKSQVLGLICEGMDTCAEYGCVLPGVPHIEYVY